MSRTNGVLGNSIDIHVGKNDCAAEIRADVRVDEFDAKRIWGQVLNCNNEPIPNSLVKLVRVVCENGRKYYEGIAHTITDCEGFYQFDVCDNDVNECYKIIINKAVTGQELVIDTMGGNCNACANGNGGNGGNGAYNPCKPYNPIVKPYDKNECNCSCNPCAPYYPPYNGCGCYDNYGYNDCTPCDPCNPCNPDPCKKNNNNNNGKTNYATYTR